MPMQIGFNRLYSTNSQAFDNNVMHHQARLLSNPTGTHLADNTFISTTYASTVTDEGSLKRDDSYEVSHSKHHDDRSSSLIHPIDDDRLVNVSDTVQVFCVDEIIDNYINRTHPCQVSDI